MAITRRSVLSIISSLIGTGAMANYIHNDKSRRMTASSRLPNGVLTAVLTPMNKHLDADYSQLVNHINWLLKRGNDGIGLLGSTGEANSFNVEERMRILDEVVNRGVSPNKLLVGTGCCAITDTITLTRHAQSYGVGGILVLPPFYYKKISDQGIEDYFAKLFDEVGINNIEIYLYHFPQLTGVPFNVGLVEKLVSVYPRNIVGMKDSGGEWTHMEEIIKAIPGFRFYTGSEKHLLSVLKAGGVGCISASTNLMSPEAATVYQAWKDGSGEVEQNRLSALRDVLEKYPFIGVLKYLYATWSGNKDWLNIRPPNVILSKEEGVQVENLLRELNYNNPFKD